MSISFSGPEILEMAVKMERDGADFYRKASEMFHNPYIHDLLVKFSKWEKKHEEIFSHMRQQLYKVETESGGIDPDSDLSLYLQTMQGLDVFGGKKALSDELTGNETMRDVISKAIEKEKDSIIFYLALKAFVPTVTAREKIEDIIKEEMEHIAILMVSLHEHM